MAPGVMAAAVLAFVGDVAAAQEPSSATLTPAGEPGERLVIRGRVVDAAGAPVAGARVYAYQADASGVYVKGPRDDPRQARLKATVRSGPDGAFELVTIRPGAYPRGGVPAHVHFLVTAPGGAEQDFEIVFEGDPDVRDSMRRQSASGGPFLVRPLKRGTNGWEVTAEFRLR